MADDTGLWSTVLAGREAVLATINSDGRPQLSNVLYIVDPATETIRISTTADRRKAKNLARDPRAALHVPGSDFWQYAVIDATVSLSAVAAVSGDAAVEELFTVHSAFYGSPERPAFDQEMIDSHRLVLRLRVDGMYGLRATSGRRPVTTR
jgi:PPOX class probable F420-dependent enzyme